MTDKTIMVPIPDPGDGWQYDGRRFVNPGDTYFNGVEWQRWEGVKPSQCKYPVAVRRKPEYVFTKRSGTTHYAVPGERGRTEQWWYLHAILPAEADGYSFVGFCTVSGLESIRAGNYALALGLVSETPYRVTIGRDEIVRIDYEFAVWRQVD